MMNEVAIVTSSKDAGGIGVYDLVTGTPVCTNFKNCVADSGAMCLLGGQNAYSGTPTLTCSILP